MSITKTSVGPLSTQRDPLPVGSRYELLVKIASGGMASVYVGRLRGAVGFWRLVAIKRAHAHLLEYPEFRRMLIAEAHLASKIHHPNVVAVQDVEQLDEELLLVMDYVEGAALNELEAIAVKAERPLPPRVVLRIALDACAGLHAAHELTDEEGQPLGIIHRDVSPQNLLVGFDGMARLADFGIAKCAESGTSLSTTGALKGKVGYMSPEYIGGGRVDARHDVFGLGVVVWEALTNRRLFRGVNELETLRLITEAPIPSLSEAAPWLGTWLVEAMGKALERSPERRYASARAFAEALEAAARAHGETLASHAEVGALVKEMVGAAIEKRRARVRERVAAGASADAPAPPAAIEPVVPALEVAALPPGPDARPAGSELTTLGSGVSARPLAEPRLQDPTLDGARRRRRTVLVAAAALVAVVVAIVGVSRWDAAPEAAGPPALGSEVTSAAATPVLAAEPAPSVSAAPPVASASASAATSASAAPIAGGPRRPGPQQAAPRDGVPARPASTAPPLPSGLSAPAPNPYATSKR